MNRLNNDQARCSGRYNFYTSETCQDRDRCLRYLHFLRLDRDAGIENYQGIPVMQAVKNCEMKLEVEPC